MSTEFKPTPAEEQEAFNRLCAEFDMPALISLLVHGNPAVGMQALRNYDAKVRQDMKVERETGGDCPWVIREQAG